MPRDMYKKVILTRKIRTIYIYNNCNSHFPRSVNRVRGWGKEGELDLCGLIFVLVFYVRVVSGNRTGMGSQVGIEWDGQTCGIHTPRLVGLASLSVQQVNRFPSQLKNTPGLGSNAGFQIVMRPCFHGATARPFIEVYGANIMSRRQVQDR